MKKILYFDSWTGGLEDFMYLDKYLSKFFHTQMLHTESLIAPYLAKNIDTSWYKKQPEQIIGNVVAKDISAYKGWSIYKIFKHERPAVVVMLSLSHIQNRVVTVACQRLNIPVVFMMHGAVGDLNGNKKITNELQEAFKYEFRYKLMKIPKFLKFLKQYYYASGSIVDTCIIAKQLFLSPFSFVWAPQKHKSLDVDMILAYSKRFADSLHEVFHIPQEKIKALGNPKLDNIISKKVKKQSKERYGLLYLEGSFVELGLMREAKQEEVFEFLKTVAEQNNITLAIRLHPGTSREVFIEKYKHLNLYFVEVEESLEDSFASAKILCGHGSTALLEAVAHEVPTISMLWFDEENLKLNFFNDNDKGIVTKKEKFSEKVQEFLKTGFMQQETREELFPNNNIPAAQLMSEEIVSLINSKSS